MKTSLFYLPSVGSRADIEAGMSSGRANAGFARGYQRRWVDILAQHSRGIQGALPHQHDAVDAANRAAFEENFAIIKKCWTEEMLTHDGKLWQVPVAGIPWDIEATRLYGKGAPDGIVEAVGVVPKLLQKPHPPLFQPFASSDNSIRWCAREGVTAVLPTMHVKHENRLAALYVEESGRPPGNGVAYLRDVVVAETDAEAFDLWQQASRFAAEAWFVQGLRCQGMFTALLTGDRQSVATRVGKAVGADQVDAVLSPQDKVEALADLSRRHGPMAMVGDGINDGPVLATAAVGVAVGGATDLARETADVVLPEDGLHLMPWVIDVAVRVRRTIRINLASAFGYNVIALTLAAVGWLQPVVAALLMVGSSLVVIANSLRLSKQCAR